MNLTRPRDSDSACWRWRLKNMYNLNIFFRWVIWWEWENFTLSLFDFGHNFYYKTVFLAQTLLLILKACVSNCLDMSLIGRFISISNFLCVKWNPSLSFSHHLLSASFLVWQVAPPSSQLLSLQPGTDMISLSLTSYIPSITKSFGFFLFPKHLSAAHLPVTPLSFSACGLRGPVWIPLKSSTSSLSIHYTFLPSTHFSPSLTAEMIVKNANLVISWHFLNFWWYRVRIPYQDLGAKDLGSLYFCHHDTSFISIDFPQLHWTSCSIPS